MVGEAAFGMPLVPKQLASDLLTLAVQIAARVARHNLHP